MENNRFLDAMNAIVTAINENKDFLTDLDREIGDADHGVNMARGFNAVMEKLNQSPPNSLQVGLKTVAMTLISTVGGASDPLYGTAFLRSSAIAESQTEISALLASQMLRAATDGIEARGGASPGDKTMVDALEAACAAFEESQREGQSLLGCLEAACEAGEKAVEYTKTIAARKGRASYLGDRSIGHQDPGATSVTIILKALTEYCRSVDKE